MKRNLLLFSMGLGAVLLGTAFLGCGKRPAQAPPGPAATPPPPTPAQETPAEITLTVWDWHAADPSKGVGLWLTEIDRAFEKAHPSIKIKHVAQSHTEYYEIFKAAAAAASPEKGPDVVMLHEGNRVLDNRGSLTPLDPYLTPEFKAKIVGWELVSQDYNPQKTAWAVPIAVQGLVWYYNKKLLREAGFDPEDPPRKWDQFLKVCEAMKARGKAGLAIGEKEGFWADWFLNTAYFQTCAPEDRERLRTGQMPWTDPKLVRILEKLKELSDRGCFQKGALSTPLFPDAGEVFMRGEAAFFLGLISDVAHWKELGDLMGPENLGVTTCPVFQESPRADFFPTGGAFAYAVTRWSPHPREAFEYIAFIASDENARTFLTDVGSFPANQSVPLERFTDPNARKIAGWLAAGKAGPQLTDLLPTEVGEAFRRQSQALLAGTVSVTQALEAVEAAARKARSR